MNIKSALKSFATAKSSATPRPSQLTAGSQADLAFDIPANRRFRKRPKPAPLPRTAVLLHVPADAKVYLCGNGNDLDGAGS